MGLFDVFRKKEDLPDAADGNIVAVCKGEMIEASRIEDPVFAGEILGKTIGFIPESGEIVSPCNGMLEVLFPTGHAFAVRMKDGTGILVHIGINTVDLNGKGFKVYAKQGTAVKAGQKIVEVDLDMLKNDGFCTTTMIIISEPVNGETYTFSPCGHKEKSEIILY